ncbi:MAG: DUF503 domain-containing protein [Terriglobales bacterium]|jgi:uncharacterized protein YlxP (DUF503 family)
MLETLVGGGFRGFRLGGGWPLLRLAELRLYWSGLRYTLLKKMIAFLTLELRIEGAHSLKDKRQVTRSLKDRLRSSFNVAVAELEPSPLWNQATIGVVSVSHSRDYLDGLMKNVERAATRIANNAGAEVTDSFVEFL